MKILVSLFVLGMISASAFAADQQPAKKGVGPQVAVDCEKVKAEARKAKQAGAKDGESAPVQKSDKAG